MKLKMLKPIQDLEVLDKESGYYVFMCLDFEVISSIQKED